MHRDDAVRKLHEWVQSPSLRRHSYVVECVMRGAAAQYGDEAAQDSWGITGLLHDADYERYPEEHPRQIVTWLRQRGEETIAYAISAHYTAWNVPYRSPLEKALVACDELSGLIVACSLLRPDGILSLTPDGVLKKMKDKKFAAGVDRSEVLAGVQLLQVDLASHIAFVLDTLRPHATTLGLNGARDE